MGKKKCPSKAKAKPGTDATGILTDIKENKPLLRGTSTSINQPSKTIGKLIHYWLTDKEASDILLQFHKACIPNHQALWSGMPRATAQQWADAHGFQTLTTSLGPLLRTDDPDCCYCQKTKTKRSNYIHGASIVFAWFISQGDLVTILSQPPPQRFHPTGRTFYQLYEEPLIKGMLGNRPVTRIVVAHPTIQSALDFTLQLFAAAGFDRIVVEAAGKRKKPKKDKKLNDKSLSTRKTWNDLQEMTIQKLERDDSSMSLQLLIDAAYGRIIIEVGETMEEKKARKKAEEMDRNLARMMKKEARRKDSSKGHKFDGGRKITIEKLVKDESSESLQLLIDAAYGMIQIEVGESKEERRQRKKRERMDMKIGWAMQNATKKKQRGEMSGKNNETKQATTNVSDNDGLAQNTRSKTRAKQQLQKLEKKRAKEEGSGIVTIEKVKRFLGKRL
ncbi:hypothetical protein FAVG1_07633 [Fusarium avenaceum]|nr:hypothetical protein FAVG1_07633 [Fusarium avenaceum]